MHRTPKAQLENELHYSLAQLIHARGENLVQFLSLIIDKLILLMIRPPTIKGQIGIKALCLLIWHLAVLL